jgi:hypothetical protein
MPTPNEHWAAPEEDEDIAKEFRKYLGEIHDSFKDVGWAVFSSPKGFEPMMESAQLGLDKVRINKSKLLEKLQQNLEKHKAEFEDALAGWKREVVEEMSKNLALATKGEEFRLHVHLEKPHDHSEDYKHVISLLTASEDDIVVISAGEFRQYHDDQWRWKDSHTESVMNYSAKRLRQ